MAAPPFRVAVVGAAGQLGTDIVSVLARHPGFDATPFARSELDVADAAAVDEAIVGGGFDAVVNAAAMTDVDRCEERGEEALTVNARGAYLVARAATRAGARHLLFSTDFVFGGEAGAPYSESARPRPINLYGATKLAGETMAGIVAPEGLIVRIASVFGRAGARGKGGNFVEAIVGRARRGERLRVIDDIRMSPTYAADVAEALPALLASRASGLLHLTNSGACSWYQFAVEILRLSRLEAEIEAVPANSYPRVAPRPSDSSLQSERLAALLGRRLRPWQEALRSYLAEKEYLP